MHERLAARLHLTLAQVTGAVTLLEAGNTLPFIARYRKEATHGLDEEQLRRLQQEWQAMKSLEERRETILQSLREQGVLTPALEKQVRSADSMTAVEDVYLPYRPKRKTRASVAREKGLQPLADQILAQPAKFSLAPSAEDWSGARDIVAETMAETPEVRQALRQKAMRFGGLQVKKNPKADDPKQTYANYYEYQSLLSHLRPHQILAIDRGENEKVLSVSLKVDERDVQGAVAHVYRPNPRSPLEGQLREALDDGIKRLLLPALEREVRRSLTEQAHGHAIASFAKNLEGLLTTPPLSGHVVLGVDPGFRTGCKLAVVDPSGKVLDTGVCYLHQEREAEATLQKLCARWKVTLIAIGNGTASRETETLVARQMRPGLAYLIVNEAGASVYSASPLARQELPDLDVTLRGAVSIARRVLDPLAELVKIEPRSIGVGMYQHDLDAKRLDEALTSVVESVVNRVGVELNTASPALLSYVAGVGPKLAEKIVAHRNEQGPFKNRQQLLKVAGLGPKVFQQAAGFLRVRQGSEPLDASAIHPESYGAARQILARSGLSLKDSLDKRQSALKNLPPVPTLAAELGVGEPTLKDILEQLARPGRDPREDLPPPLLRQDVVKLEDLVPGQTLHGTVRNVVDFGAFVDLGVKQDGLLHRSQIPRGESLAVGQVIEVKVLEVDRGRGRISLGIA